MDVWDLGGILDLNNRNVSGWQTGWDFRAGIQGLFGAGLALLDYWWLVLGRTVAGADGWDGGWVHAAGWMGDSG